MSTPTSTKYLRKVGLTPKLLSRQQDRLHNPRNKRIALTIPYSQVPGFLHR